MGGVCTICDRKDITVHGETLHDGWGDVCMTCRDANYERLAKVDFRRPGSKAVVVEEIRRWRANRLRVLTDRYVAAMMTSSQAPRGKPS